MDAEVAGQGSAPPELAALAAEIAAADSASASPGAPGVAAPGAPAAPARSIAKEIATLLSIAAAVVAPVLPSVAAIYTAPTCQAIADAVAPVCEKHGWLRESPFVAWGAELAALGVLAPIGLATYQAAMADLAKLRARTDAQPDRAPPQASTAAAGDARSTVELVKPISS